MNFTKSSKAHKAPATYPANDNRRGVDQERRRTENTESQSGSFPLEKKLTLRRRLLHVETHLLCVVT